VNEICWHIVWDWIGVYGEVPHGVNHASGNQVLDVRCQMVSQGLRFSHWVLD